MSKAKAQAEPTDPGAESPSIENPTDLEALEKAVIKTTSGQQEIAAMKQALERSARELMKENRVFMVSMTLIHEDGTGNTMAVLTPPGPNVVPGSEETIVWETKRRSALVHLSAHLKLAHDSITRMVCDIMAKGHPRPGQQASE